jgi:zinc transporter 2
MATAKTNSSHGHTHSHAIEVHDEESGDPGVVVVEEGYDPARMKCAATRCGLESAGSLAADLAKRAESSQTLSKAVVVCLVFMAIEVAGGVMANSLAIFTDAAHMLTDVAGFAISLFAIWASGWEATPSQTFGFARLEILGALGSILLIWLLTGILAYEAIHRLFFAAVSNAVDGRLMFIIATLGLLVNLAMMYLLGHNHGHGHDHDHGHGHDHNVSGHDHSHEETNQVHTGELVCRTFAPHVLSF